MSNRISAGITTTMNFMKKSPAKTKSDLREAFSPISRSSTSHKIGHKVPDSSNSVSSGGYEFKPKPMPDFRAMHEKLAVKQKDENKRARVNVSASLKGTIICL
jgi:hypothetical protein